MFTEFIPVGNFDWTEISHRLQARDFSPLGRFARTNSNV